MVKTSYLDKNGMKKGAWSNEEDEMLRRYITRYGHWNWRELPKFAGLSRCGKSCRLRWMNYLRPNLKRGSYTKEEDELIIKLYKEHGTKWSLMAKKLPGRTDNEIKNHWHTKLKKLVLENPQVAKENDRAKEEVLEDDDSNIKQDNEEKSNPIIPNGSEVIYHQDLKRSLLALEAPPCELSSSEDETLTILKGYPFEDVNRDFWIEPFAPDTVEGNLSSWTEGQYICYNYEDLLFDLQQLYD